MIIRLENINDWLIFVVIPLSVALRIGFEIGKWVSNKEERE